MRFHALLPVRDEADIVGQCLAHLLTWVDAVYVFDTGSVAETWEIVQDFAGRDKRVVALRKDPVYFSETRLRGWMFHQARQQMRDGDWFLRVDVDEFHHIPPPEFVRTRMRKHETIAYHQYYNFALRASEVKAWEAGEETLADRARPIADRRQWFIPSVYSEPRLCRYRETMQWPATVSFPCNAGFVARERLPIRHYPHRDPAQLNRRCLLRAFMMTDPTHDGKSFMHWNVGEWREFITPDDVPELKHWQPGTELPEFNFTNHLSEMPKRITQRVAHAALLAWLDARRARWSDDSYPERISTEIVARLENELKMHP